MTISFWKTIIYYLISGENYWTEVKVQYQNENKFQSYSDSLTVPWLMSMPST